MATVTLWYNKKGFSFLFWTELDGGSPMDNTKLCIHLPPPPPTSSHLPPTSTHLHAPSTLIHSFFTRLHPPSTFTHLPPTFQLLPLTFQSLHPHFCIMFLFLRVHLSVNLSKLTRFFIKGGFYKNRLDLHTFKVGGGGWKVSGGRRRWVEDEWR